ncbi:MAG: aminotransferase class I/II-fold pyridoxal phosphate-dependent enzyme [Pirellulales bacterium]|nr:aminotransferase class I/II-fold pyridoxal phosphate-dependent enzyme [Pirellulales bacterium]
MHGYVPGEQPRDMGIIKLNTNENPYPSSPAVRQAIDIVLNGGLQRYPDPLATAFRLVAAEVLGIEPSWILCGNGSDDLLTIATRAFVGQGDCLRLPYPSYILYKTLAQLQGAEADEVYFQEDWSLGDEFAIPRPRLKLAFLPNPNSPSGTIIAPERVRELAAALPCPLLVDEAYADFADTNCMKLVKETEKVMVARSFSKSYALAGLRFGYIVAQPHMIEQLTKVKDSYNCDALSIAGATAAIGDQGWLADNRAKILTSRAKLTAGMKSLGFATVESQSNFVWNPHPRRPVKPLYERLKEQNVMVRYMNYSGWGDGLRISVGTDEQVERCLTLLRGML